MYYPGAITARTRVGRLSHLRRRNCRARVGGALTAWHFGRAPTAPAAPSGCEPPTHPAALYWAAPHRDAPPLPPDPSPLATARLPPPIQASPTHPARRSIQAWGGGGGAPHACLTRERASPLAARQLARAREPALDDGAARPYRTSARHPPSRTGPPPTPIADTTVARGRRGCAGFAPTQRTQSPSQYVPRPPPA
ncbi:hypothetical protein HYPSUDRAFT_199982 [Hypholoma sublateritium FD-334 SS-4]|uniref:Uncharacterized protein n=1 Tax=Hypholoma sublateritium (strain FD-334 SS-4) TaxID=945553 RepID=A0A0D2LCQ5_HYPSF|nr:hypothetical protein HYPSUDRAFT_199982 [Hypholoma sublateritium FD-334 SS-4]